MFNSLSRLIVLIAGVYVFYRYRYRIMNSVLGHPQVRRMFVVASMKIPFIRKQMMNQAFR